LKVDRLIGITIYLLNRNIVSVKELAERFEVSVRTIVRDMETLPDIILLNRILTKTIT